MSNGRLLIGTDVRVREIDGAYFSTHSSLSDDSLDRFNGSRRATCVVARGVSSAALLSDSEMSGLNCGCLILLETENSRFRIIRLLRTLVLIMRLDVTPEDLIYVRLPEVVGTLLAIKAFRMRAKFVVNVVAEPDAYAGKFGPFSHFAARILRAVYTAIAARAAAAVYVTEFSLQKQLPYYGSGRSYSVSNVRFPKTAVVSEVKKVNRSRGISIVSTGTMNSNVKGFDTLITALALLHSRNERATLRLIGGGDSRPDLEDLATRLGVGEYVEFCGYVKSSESVRELLKESDIFVLASRQEGLPRAMIEAMACGIPAIGSDVGGIPELVPKGYLFEPGDAVAIAELISTLSADSSLAEELAQSQLDHAYRIVQIANSDVFARCVNEI